MLYRCSWLALATGMHFLDATEKTALDCETRAKAVLSGMWRGRQCKLICKLFLRTSWGGELGEIAGDATIHGSWHARNLCGMDNGKLEHVHAMVHTTAA